MILAQIRDAVVGDVNGGDVGCVCRLLSKLFPRYFAVIVDAYQKGSVDDFAVNI